jgi:iron complex outermembrane recepter protein
MAPARVIKSTNGSIIAIAISAALGSAAMAQEDSTGQGARDASLEEITVTGSRIRRTTDFDTANPTTVVDAAFLQNLGMVNVGDAIQQLPTNLSVNTPNTTGNANFFSGSTIANLRGLNPFFGSRTLNLVNSRRFVPTNQGDGVDLNFIPSVLIERVDVVTGGASAAYGSGAISGVNNIFLNRKLEGGKLEFDFAQTDESDGDEKHIGAAYGLAFAEGRGHMTFGYEFEDTDPIGCFRVRDWCAEGNGFHQNVPGMHPSNILGTNIRSNQMSTTGTFYLNNARLAALGNPTTTFQADAAGTGVIPFNLGAAPFAGASPTAVVPGGDGKSIYQYTNLRAPVHRNIGTATFTYALTDSLNMNVDLSYGKVETVDINGALDAANTVITPQNAFLTPALLAAQTAARGTLTGTLANPLNAALNKDWTSQVFAHSEFTTEVKRAVVAFDGKFGDSSWGWDAYYQFGDTTRRQLVADNRHNVAYTLAIDSVIGPDGQPRCRVANAAEAVAMQASDPMYPKFDPTLANGCVPLNPFGNQPLSAAQKGYAFGNLDENLDYRQQVLAINASGDLFAGFGAGPIQGAIGAEYRIEEGENIAEVPAGTSDAVRTDFLIQYGESFSGDVDVTEGYAEISLPFLKDKPFAKRLDLDLAVRESHYKNQGKAGTTGLTKTHDMTTWKASAVWDPLDWLRFRSTISRDSRAANFRELYYRQIIGAGGTFGFCEPFGAPARDPCTFDLRGNVDLEPEKSDTVTFGLVFKPEEFLPGFSFAADYFRINIEDAILQANSAAVLNGCRVLNNPTFCAQLDLGPPTDPANPLSNIEVLNAFASNGSAYTFKGVDFTGSYAMDFEGSSLYVRLLATKMINQLFQNTPGGAFVNVVGQTGTGNNFLADQQPAAEWLANLSATWTRGPLSLTGQVRYVADGTMDYNGITPDDPRFAAIIAGGAIPIGMRTISTNKVPSYEVFALSGSYKFEGIGPLESLQIFGVVDNLFDKEPPIAPGGGAFGPANANGGTNAIFFDTQGRTFRLGVRTTF